MQKIRSRVLMDSEKHISELVHKVEKPAIWGLNCHYINQKVNFYTPNPDTAGITVSKVSLLRS